MRINLDLLQKIAEDQEKKSPFSKKNNSILSDSSSAESEMITPKTNSKSSTISMGSSIKKASIMPEIPEKPPKKNSKKSIISTVSKESKKSEESEESEESSDSENSEHSEKSLEEEEKLSVSHHSNESLESSSHLMESSVIDPDFVYYMSNMKKFNTKNCRSTYFKELYCEHLLQSFKALCCIKHLHPIDKDELDYKKISLPILEKNKGF